MRHRARGPLAILILIGAAAAAGRDDVGGVAVGRAGRYEVLASLDAPDAGAAQRIAVALDRFERAWRAWWDPHLVLRPAREGPGIVVYVYSDRRRLGRALRSLGARLPSFEAGGAWLPDFGAIAIASESRLERALVGSAIHEAAHMLNLVMLDAPRVTPWFSEGLAQFAQFSALDEDGGIRIGAIDSGATLRFRSGDEEILYAFDPRRNLSFLTGQWKRGAGRSLAPLLEATDPDALHRDATGVLHAQAWSLVHLLATGSARGHGSLREGFFRYAALEQAGRGGKDALLATLGLSLEEIERAWYRHVKRID